CAGAAARGRRPVFAGLRHPGPDDGVRLVRYRHRHSPATRVSAAMDGAAIVEFLAASIRIATPLLFGALGGLLSERAGTFAVGIEGMMLAGAFGGAVTTLLPADAGMGPAVSAGSRRGAGHVVRVAAAQ